MTTDEASGNEVVPTNAQTAVGAEEPPNAGLKSWLADALDVNGGFALLAAGAGLIALACVFAANAAVAPIFAVSGAGMIVLGVFYSRIEGNVQATRDGITIAVRAAQRRAIEENLPVSLTADVVERAIAAVEISSRRPAEIQRAADAAAREAVQWGALRAKASHDDTLRHFAAWLSPEADFPTVRIEVPTPQGQYDLIAENSEAILIAEAKVGRLVGDDAVAQLLRMPAPEDLHARTIRRALVIAADTVISEHAILAAKAAGVEVYDVSGVGRVHKLA